MFLIASLLLTPASSLQMIFEIYFVPNDAKSILSAFYTIKQKACIRHLQINESKSNWLFIGRTASSFINANFAPDNKAMSSVFLIKDLGVFINCDPNFNKHIDDKN